jgi:polar amino acid transport system substrate-binding protein
MRYIKYTVTSLLVLPLMVFSPLSQAGKLDEIKAKGEVRVAVLLDSAPWGFTDAQGKSVGIDIDLAAMVAKGLNVKLTLAQITAANRIPYLLTNKADLVIAGLGHTPERAQQVAFTRPYATTQLGVYGGPEIGQTKNLADLSTYTIALSKGSTIDLALTEANPKGKYLRMEDTASAMAAFINGQVPLFGENSLIAQRIIEDNPGKNISMKFLIRSSPAYMAVAPRNTDFLDWLNTFIAERTADGSLAQVRLKWFKDEQKDIPDKAP